MTSAPMVKKLAGLCLGATFVAMFAGSSSGCSSDDPLIAPQDAQVAEVRPRIDRDEVPTLACLEAPLEFVYRPPLDQAGSAAREIDQSSTAGSGDLATRSVHRGRQRGG